LHAAISCLAVVDLSLITTSSSYPGSSYNRKEQSRSRCGPIC